MRSAYQILAFPFYRKEDRPMYALFRRRDSDIWQGIAGGGEDRETPIQTALREANEEAEISLDAKIVQLSSVATIPVEYVAGFIWGEDVLVVPEYTFGIEMGSEDLKIGKEHSEYKWFNYDDAIKQLKWDSNKTALWELNHRIEKNKLQNIRKAI
jgi:dATP pyrophosphohydrolase